MPFATPGAGQDRERVHDGLVGAEPDALAQAEGEQVVRERRHAGAAVTTDQHPGALLDQQLGERVGQHRDVVRGIAGGRLAGAQ